MASIAYPSSASRPNLWSFNQAQATTTSYKGWPNSSEKVLGKTKDEESSREVLDFAKLENDIIKNVLGEEEKRLEMKKEETDIFPSFNYIPPPIPHSFLKSNPILKLYPRDMLTAMNLCTKQADSTAAPQLTSISTNKPPPDRHRFHYPDPLPQIPEVSSNSTSTTKLKPGFEHPYKTSQSTSSTASVGCTSNGPVTKTASQYLYSVPKTTMYNSSCRTQEKKGQKNHTMPLAENAKNYRLSPTHRNNSNCLGVSKVELTVSHAQPLAASSILSEPKRVKVASNQTNLICRNFPTAATNTDSRRKNPTENVKTFAQIVAAATKPASASSAKSEYYRYHE